MSRSLDPRIDALERRLVNHSNRDVPSGHRERVLAAVRDVLAIDHEATVARVAVIGPQGIAALLAIAVSTAMVIAVPWLFVRQPLLPVAPASAVAIRARAAGIDLPVETVAATAPDRTFHQPRRTPSPMPDHDAIRWRHLITGDL